MSQNNERPLVSLVVFSFRQREFVEDAVRGAFAQTYPNLEIILSDDGSEDGTYELMEQLAASYSGPHRVVLNQKTRNMGLPRHLNQILRLANGEWIFLNAGDDQSLPHRISTVMKSVTQTTTITGAFSGYHCCDEYLTAVEPITPLRRTWSAFSICRNGGYVFTGATFGFHRDSITAFGELAPDIRAEDWVYPLRAALKGKVICIPELLLKKRTLQNSLTQINKSEDQSESPSEFLKPELVANLDAVDQSKQNNIASRLQTKFYQAALKRHRQITQCRIEERNPSKITIARAIIASLLIFRKNDLIDLCSRLFRSSRLNEPSHGQELE